MSDFGASPPEDLPADPASYWEAPGLPQRPAIKEPPSALERLGASPFPKSRFPFLGFLATVYDQVAQSVRRGDQTSAPSGGI
jgi:hypothetical protein